MGVATKGARKPMERNPETGQYVARQPQRCAVCGWTLAENLLGQLLCLHEGCVDHRKVVGTVPGVEVSPELVAALTPDPSAEQPAEPS